MGLKEMLFPKKAAEQQMTQFFQTLTAYQPVFTTFSGGLYEMMQTRAAIHTIAKHCAKLKPEVIGAGNKELHKKLQTQPNPFMDTTKFIYRLATILMTQNNAFIVPLYDKTFEKITGYFPVLPSECKLVTDNVGTVYIRYTFRNGTSAVMELEKVGLLNQMQYYDDIFGENNSALMPTLQMLSTVDQGIVEGVKSSATLRFMAKLAQTLKPADIEAERKRFVENNLSTTNNGGVLLYDPKYAEVKQIESKPYMVDAEQMALINSNVYNYFGVNEKIMQSKYNSEEWAAFYESVIEPFAIQLSLVMTNMTFTDRERAFGNEIIFSANRLQYASNKEKLDIATQLTDRGIITLNDAREIFNMPPVDGGDVRVIRGEYANADDKTKEGSADANKE